MSDSQKELLDTISEIDQKVEELLVRLGKTFGEGAVCYPLMSANEEITSTTVDEVFDDLRESEVSSGHLVVLVDSGGGDIDAAYNLAMLFRRYGYKRLIYVVPRWAKSAATLLVCGGDTVMMTPVAELGPLDPQITQMNPLEQRLERFSPLHIESTLELIRNEFSQGNTDLAQGLMQRLQFPITLGTFTKSLELGKQYAEKLLMSRMFENNPQVAQDVASRLVEDYADHGFCINIDEAKALGLTVEELPEDQLEPVWDIHKLTRRRSLLLAEKRQNETMERLRELDPTVLEDLPPGILGRGKEQKAGDRQ